MSLYIPTPNQLTLSGQFLHRHCGVPTSIMKSISTGDLVRHSSAEWNETWRRYYGIIVADARGWDMPNAKHYWDNVPITHIEFEQRLAKSTTKNAK